MVFINGILPGYFEFGKRKMTVSGYPVTVDSLFGKDFSTFFFNISETSTSRVNELRKLQHKYSLVFF